MNNENLNWKSSDLDKSSIRKFYEDNTHAEVFNDAIDLLVKICPPEEFGEDEDCSNLQDIIGEMQFRIEDLEEHNRRLTATLELVGSHTKLMAEHIKNQQTIIQQLKSASDE